MKEHLAPITQANASIAAFIPADVKKICRRLAEHGCRGYVVGGSIRDLLMNRVPTDWDIATTATPDTVQRIFPRTVPTGIDHGTVTVLVGKTGYELTTLRGEGAYSDGRRPDSVEFLTDINQDLSRRDFTVNAIAFDPIDEVLHDPFDGRGDIGRGLLRTVGDAVTRFEEDGLRVLRGARFVATLEFTVEPKTKEGMRRCCAMLRKVSTERKRDELRKLLLAARPSLGLTLAADTTLLPHLLDVLPSRFEQAHLARIDGVDSQLTLRLAAMLAPLDLRAIHDAAGTDALLAGLACLKFDNKTARRVAQVLSNCACIYQADMSDADLRRWVRPVGFEVMYLLVELWRADANALQDASYVRLVGELAQRVEGQERAGVPMSVKQLAVGGRDLMSELARGAGPWVGDALEHLLSLVLDTPSLNNREDLMRAARIWMEKSD